MVILGIETSCDETSAAVVEDGRLVRSCIIASSRTDFTNIGGIIPEEAARKQLETILPVIEESLAKAGITMEKIDAIAVTNGPGLLGSLLVGATTARVLATVFKKPIIPVHHTMGHLSSIWLLSSDPLPPPGREGRVRGDEEPQFPLVTLSVSGGHTDLWYRTSHAGGVLLGSTRDDAAGEAFDKGASLLGLPYPGGPALEKLARGGDEERFKFPLPLKKEDTLDFSLSGLKTSLKYLLRDLRVFPSPRGGGARGGGNLRADIAASYQLAICAHLVDRLERALKRYDDAREVHIVGGVSANERLRLMAKEALKGIALRTPVSLRYCTDNGAMIASAGFFLLTEQPAITGSTFTTSARMELQPVLEGLYSQCG